MSKVASEIISEISLKYSTCRTYCDSGVAVEGSDIIRFSTKFVRPSHFLFQYTVGRPDGVVQKTQAVRCIEGRAQYTLQGKWVDVDDLSFALIVTAGSCAGVSAVINRLLFCTIDDEQWQQFFPYELLANTANSRTPVLHAKSKTTQVTESIQVDLDSMSVLEHEYKISNIFSAVMARRMLEIILNNNNAFALALQELMTNSVIYATNIKFNQVSFDRVISFGEDDFRF